MNLGSLALRNLRRRPTRSLILVLSVALAVATALTLIAVSASIENSVRQGVDERGADVTVSQRDSSDALSGNIPDTMEARLWAVKGVARVAGELAMFAPVERSQQMLVLGWTPNSFFWKQMPLSEGRVPQAGETQVAVIGEGAARRLNKKVGDEINVFDEPFKVIGIAKYASKFNRALVILPLRGLQDVGFRPGQVTIFHVELGRTPKPEFERVRLEIEQLGRLDATPTDQLLRSDRNLDVQRAISQVISIIALTMGALSVFSALLTAIQERAREFGIMMAIGWSKLRIMGSIVTEGAVVGFLGVIVGVPFAFAASLTFSALPTIGPYISFQPSFGLILPSALLTIMLCGLGSLYPAWRATAHAPADALRRP